MKFINELYDIIMTRKHAHATQSYTAKLFARGTAKIAQKVGEEAVETVIEAMRGDKERLKEESADLLYHLLVLWADQGVTIEDIETVLQERHRDAV